MYVGTRYSRGLHHNMRNQPFGWIHARTGCLNKGCVRGKKDRNSRSLSPTAASGRQTQFRGSRNTLPSRSLDCRLSGNGDNVKGGALIERLTNKDYDLIKELLESTEPDYVNPYRDEQTERLTRLRNAVMGLYTWWPFNGGSALLRYRPEDAKIN